MLCWAYVDACCINMEPCWPTLGRCWLMWGNVGTIFDIGLILSHFGLILGSCWGTLGYVLAFIWFRCRWVLGPCKAYVKNTVNTTKKNNMFWLCCWCFWCYVKQCLRRSLRGIFLVLRWHLNGTFGGVWVVSCWCVSWWWWHGMLWALIIWVDISMMCCICAHNTQYTSIHNIKQSCTLVAHDISSATAFPPVLAGMT